MENTRGGRELLSLSQLQAYIPNATTVRRRLPPSLEVDDPELMSLTSEVLLQHSFAPATEHKLVKDTIYWARRYDKDYNTRTANNPAAIALLIGEVATATSEFIAHKWLGTTCVKLALRHEPQDIDALALNYATHPMLDYKKCRHYIAAHVGDPHQTLQAITAYFQAARTQHDILQLSNSAIFDLTTIEDMRQGNFEPLIQAEFAAYQPLSPDPESALDQLREVKRSKTQTEATLQSISGYIQSVLADNPGVTSRMKSLGLRQADLSPLISKYAAYADLHDYDSLAPTQLCAIAQEHLLEVQGVTMHGVKASVAAKILLDYTPNYLNEFFTVASQRDVTVGRALGILKKWCNDPLWQLYAVATHRDDLMAACPDITAVQAIQLALNTIGGEKTAEEISYDLQGNLDTCRLLFGDRLSNSYITSVCIESPNNCTQKLTSAHVLVGELYSMYDDPCMPRGFLQEMVEKTDKKTLTRRLINYTWAIRDTRRDHPDWPDKKIWLTVFRQFKNPKNKAATKAGRKKKS